MGRLHGGKENDAGSQDKPLFLGIHCPEVFGHPGLGKRKVEVANLAGP